MEVSNTLSKNTPLMLLFVATICGSLSLWDETPSDFIAFVRLGSKRPTVSVPTEEDMEQSGPTTVDIKPKAACGAQKGHSL